MTLEQARAALCDLLIGRSLRIRADATFLLALLADMNGFDHADDLLEEAAHMEWIAVRAEQGLIGWGGRLNRCGYQPRTDED